MNDSFITIRFIRTPGFVTDAICFVTNSLLDHAEFGTPEGTWIGAHSDGGVRERPANYVIPSEQWVYDVPCTSFQSSQLLKNARAAIGTPYNFIGIGGLLFHARKLTGIKTVFCSQFCFFEANKVGIYLLNVLPEFSYLVTPETLHLSPLFRGHKRR
jgi:hypothetical protein